MAPFVTWGVDGFGAKHYLCRHCGEMFGPVDPYTIKHKCAPPESKPLASGGLLNRRYQGRYGPYSNPANLEKWDGKRYQKD